MEGFVQETDRRDRGRARARRGAPGMPARDLAIALNWMNERVLHVTFAGQEPAIAEDQVLDVLVSTWLAAIYGGELPDAA